MIEQSTSCVLFRGAAPERDETAGYLVDALLIELKTKIVLVWLESEQPRREQYVQQFMDERRFHVVSFWSNLTWVKDTDPGLQFGAPGVAVAQCAVEVITGDNPAEQAPTLESEAWLPDRQEVREAFEIILHH